MGTDPLLRSGPPVVGRDREAAELSAAVAAAIAGRGGTWLISGEAGIGKTRLVTAVLEQHHDRVRVGWGVCAEDEATPPLWPWRTALSQMGIEADLTGGDGRYEVAMRLASQLQSISGAVIVIDDAQWADAASIRLLEVLAPMLHATPSLLMVTHRAADPSASVDLRRALPALERAHDVRSMALAGLDATGTASLLARISEQEPSPEVVERVQARTNGNPFFVIEIGRLWPDAPDDETIPIAVRDAVRRRLNALSRECNELLRAAAVIGDEVALRHLVRVADVSRETAEALLDEATSAQIVTRAGADAFRFPHALVRETLLSELPAPARASMHLQLAELLEATRPDAVEALAFHFGEAALAGGSAKALRYYVDAASRARAEHEHAAEAVFLDHAVRLLEQDPGLGDVVSLQLDRARALYRSGALRSAWRAALAAATRARLSGRAELVAQAAARCAASVIPISIATCCD